jgi:CTP synthase (UTP-ammonia lyase)
MFASSQAHRIYRKAVIIHDHRGRQSCIAELIERLEGGDCFGFVSSGEAHMREVFDDLEMADIGRLKAWYIGRIRSPIL